jgi:hypothetical protein
MSEIKVNKITPRTDCGTTQLGDSGDTVTVTGDLRSDSLKAADGGVIISQSGTNITIGASGDTISLASGASQSGFGREGSVDWQTGSLKTSTFTAASGEGYFINSGSAITMNLPAGTAGAIVAVADYARNFSTYNLTISPNGSQKIGGVADDAKLSVDGQAATFVYVDDTKGWINVQNAEDTFTGSPPFITATGGTETTSGDFKIHTFTGPGTFAVSNVAGVCGPTRNVVSYLVLAGGGGSGDAGAGAGGYREVVSPNSPYTGSPLNGYPTPANRITVTAQNYPITVGSGGSATPQSSTSSFATKGSDSTFSTITSAGGGYGGNGSPGSGDPGVPTFYATGSSGGSGGGSAGPTTPNNTISGGAGNTPPTSPAQGNNGGAGRWQPGSYGAAGGGGGAGGAGACFSCGEGVTGGAGTASSITGSPVTRAAGGPAPTTANSGNGGRNAQAGQSGVVIIRYKFQ